MQGITQRILRPPRLKTFCVKRPVLNTRIVDAAGEKRLTLITAPSGYGKSTILSEVFRSLEQFSTELIWISGGRHDSDPARIEELLCQQLHARTNLSLEDGEDFISFAHRANPLSPFAILIDNWDFVETSETNRYFFRLIEETEGVANFVLSSRKVPDLPLESLRLAGNIAEFNMQDLHLSDEESWELLSHDNDLVPSKHLKDLLKRTEGWPVGVQLLRMALPSDAKEIEIEFSGGRESVSNYLQEAMFSRFDKPTQEFLCVISYLDEISPELVEAVLPAQNGAERFAEVRRQNLFLNEVNEGSSSYRFHSLFRDFLLARAKTIAPFSEQEICAKASHFFETRGEKVPTIRYAVRSNDHHRALKLLDNYAESSLVAQGRIKLFTQWVRVLLSSEVELSPSVAYWYRWCLVFSGRWEAAAELTGAHNEQRTAIIDAVIGAFSDDQPRMHDAVQRWVQVNNDSDPFSHAVMYCAAAINLMASGKYRSARLELRKAELFIRQTVGGFGRTWVDVIIVLADIGAGQIKSALDASARAIDEADRSLLPTAPAARMARMASAIAKYCSGDNAGVIEDLSYANNEMDDHTLPILTVMTSTIARELGVHWEKRRFEEHPPSVAIDLTAEALSLMSQTNSSVSLSKLAERIAELETKIEAVSELSVESRPYLWILPDLKDILNVRVEIANGDLDAAAAYISPAINRCQQSGRGLTEMRLSLLRTVVLYRQDKKAAAVRLLLQQAEKAVQDGLHLPFSEVSHMIQPMLGDLFSAGERISIGDNDKEWQRLCTMLGAKGSGSTEKRSIKPIMALEKGFQITAREAEILGYLDLGLSNAEIGRRMGISLPTVKWHLSNLYSKLNVKNRASAVRFARDNGFA